MKTSTGVMGTPHELELRSSSKKRESSSQVDKSFHRVAKGELLLANCSGQLSYLLQQSLVAKVPFCCYKH